jgi:hypothetical protein
VEYKAGNSFTAVVIINVMNTVMNRRYKCKPISVPEEIIVSIVYCKLRVYFFFSFISKHISIVNVTHFSNFLVS